jgi:hypothetical protein
MQYIKQHTDIPTPHVLKFESSYDNKLGLEWLIMNRVPGSKLDEQWQIMSWLKKELLVRKSISYLSQLFRKRFDHLGNLYTTTEAQQLPSADIPNTVLLGCEHSSPDTGFCLGKIVSIPFFWGNHMNLEVNREPFSNSQEWLMTHLRLHIMGIDDPVVVIKDSFGESDAGNSGDDLDPYCTPEAIKARARRLTNLLPEIFPVEESEVYVLHHGDLHGSNIFVDDDHDISSIIDWECVHTVTLWAACEIPKFLGTSRERNKCPNSDEFMKEISDNGTEELNGLYYEHLEEYETTQLRVFFLEEMQRIRLEWVEVYQKSKLMAASGEVVAVFDNSTNG